MNGADVFTLDGTHYLCVVDCYSSYFEVDRLETKTAKGITRILRKLFSSHRIPNHLISNSMPFSSQEFREFAASYESSQVYLAIPGALASLKMPTTQQNPSWRKPSKQVHTSTFPCLAGETPLLKECLAPHSQDVWTQNKNTASYHQLHVKTKGPRRCEGETAQAEVQAKYYNLNTKEFPLLQTGEVIRIAPKPGNREQKW